MANRKLKESKAEKMLAGNMDTIYSSTWSIRIYGL